MPELEIDFIHLSRDMTFQQCGTCDQQNLRSACTYAQSDQSLCLSLDYLMIVKLLAEHHLVFLSLKVGCTDSSESTLVKMPHCWKSHVAAHWLIYFVLQCSGNWCHVYIRHIILYSLATAMRSKSGQCWEVKQQRAR